MSSGKHPPIKLNEATRTAIARFTPGEYEHYKGMRYYALALSLDTETREIHVVYRPLYATNWAHLMNRPAAMFFEDVKVDGQTVPRFRPVDVQAVEDA